MSMIDFMIKTIGLNKTHLNNYKITIGYLSPTKKYKTSPKQLTILPNKLETKI